ncbi:MAG TPA: DVUA0089 family protein [Chthoniobacterales bacterium]
MKSIALVFSFLFLALTSSPAFVLEGQSWTRDRTVAIQTSLGGPHPLIDGFASFNESAQDALNSWNLYLQHLHCVAILGSPVIPSMDDDENSAFFSSTVYGDKFGSGVLAITLLSYRGDVFEESDTIFNTFYTWDSYRGALNPSLIDFHRVALHEFGHMLGLDHPDEHKQTVVAIMNSHIGDIDSLQPDDIMGVESLYNIGPAYQAAVAAPVLANISTRGLIGTGSNVLIGGFIVQGSEPATVILRAIGFSLSSVGIGQPLLDPTITVFDQDQHQIASNDDWAFDGAQSEAIASYHLDPSNSRESALLLTLEPGAYTAVVQSFTDDQNPPGTGIGLFELYDLHTTGGRAGNISTRGQVLTGDDILIGGFIIGGNDPKTVVARGLGPSLGAAGITNPLADPNLELRDANGDVLQSNDDWQQGPDAQAITTDGLAPSNAKESAVLATLNPGSYTVLLSAASGATGIGLVEVYDTSAVP